MPKKAKNGRKRLIDTSIYNSSTDEPQYNLVKNRSYELRKMQALQILNGSNMPSKFRFRDKEMERINCFLESCIKGQKKGYKFLMITGSPGAGKTLCANSLLSKRQCRIIRLNANQIKTVAQVQQLISNQLLGNETGRTALQIIRQLQQEQYQATCIIYIQQIEILFKSAPDVISEDFLMLFGRKNIKLILIGISNTIDTLQKYSSKFSFKIQDIDNVVFSPYSCEHISEIMKDKLQQIHAKTDIQIQFTEKLLKFSSQKLETLKKGDFRICLQFLKHVTKLCFSEQQQIQPQKYTIKIDQINRIFNKMNISKNSLIESLPYQQQIMLIALYTIIKKTDALYITLKQLQPELQWICNSLQVNYSKQLLQNGLKDMQQYSLVQIKKKNQETKVILKVPLGDLQGAYGDHAIFGKFFTVTD